MKLLTLCLLLLSLVNACDRGPVTHPVPSVATIGGDLKCATGDHGFEDSGAGWGFCYPGTWRYIEKAQGYSLPTRLDLTFDVTDLGVPCTPPSQVAGASPRPVCSPTAGLYGFMILSTYERGSATDLQSWMQANMNPVPVGQPIQWGNATEASLLAGGRRIALTPHHVVIMDLRSVKGQLDLEGLMSARLNTWNFLY
jgi:hypothetical protein